MILGTFQAINYVIEHTYIITTIKHTSNDDERPNKKMKRAHKVKATSKKLPHICICSTATATTTTTAHTKHAKHIYQACHTILTMYAFGFASKHTHTHTFPCLLSSLSFDCYNQKWYLFSFAVLLSVFACESISHSTEKVKWWTICCRCFRFVMVFSLFSSSSSSFSTCLFRFSFLRFGSVQRTRTFSFAAFVYKTEKFLFLLKSRQVVVAVFEAICETASIPCGLVTNHANDRRNIAIIDVMYFTIVESSICRTSNYMLVAIVRKTAGLLCWLQQNRSTDARRY